MSTNVVVVGSLHYDIIVDSVRQPLRGETLMGHRWYPKFGGKGGNQALACASLGARVYFLGAVGDDTFGKYLLSELADAGIDHTGVVETAGGSGMSVAIVDDEGDYSAVVVTGANASIDPGSIAMHSCWADADILVLQNEVPEAVNIAAAEAARDTGATVIWNAAPMRPVTLGINEFVDIAVVNAVEAEQLTGISVTDLESAQVAAGALYRQDGVLSVVTAGAHGFAWVDTQGDAGAQQAEKVDNPQSHGAGDVFTGALSVAFGRKKYRFADCVRFAGEAARLHVSGRSLSLPEYP